MKFTKTPNNNMTTLLGGKLIYRTQDDLGNILVIDYPTYRVMTFDSTYEQSRMDLTTPNRLVHNYAKAMLFPLAFIHPKHTTVLGLGGGCLLRAIHELLPMSEVEVVELRTEVVEVCKTYFGVPDSNNIYLHIADAKDYLKTMKPGYTDIIFSDMYTEYVMNPLQMKEHFLTQCHSALSEAGCLVLNFHELPDRDSPFLASIHTLFTDILICIPATGNVILFASKKKLNTDISHYANNYRRIDKDLNRYADYFFRNIVRSNGST